MPPKARSMRFCQFGTAYCCISHTQSERTKIHTKLAYMAISGSYTYPISAQIIADIILKILRDAVCVAIIKNPTSPMQNPHIMPIQFCIKDISKSQNESRIISICSNIIASYFAMPSITGTNKHCSKISSWHKIPLRLVNRLMICVLPS